MSIKKQVIVDFTPERWGELDKFQSFYSTTYTFNNREIEILRGVGRHFKKSQDLLDVALEISCNITKDEKELEQYGHTHGIHGARFSAVLESSISSLYSSVDCTCKMLPILFPKAQGLPNSTRKIFQNALENKITGEINPAIVEALKQATWYRSLRILRDTLTHSNPGSCHRDREIKKIRYFSESFKSIEGKSYVDDFMQFIETLRTSVNGTLGAIFHELNEGLLDEECWQMCGVFYGRVYHRFVRPKSAVDSNSGRCGAFEWFENPENPTCPFVAQCAAYARREITNSKS